MFNLKEELNEHFFVVHPSVGAVYKRFSFDMMVYSDVENILRKYSRDVKRKRKMKNKLSVINDKIIPMENGRKKLIKRFEKYMIAYKSAVNRYGIAEKKEELMKMADFYILGYKKLLGEIKDEPEKKEESIS